AAALPCRSALAARAGPTPQRPAAGHGARGGGLARRAGADHRHRLAAPQFEADVEQDRTFRAGHAHKDIVQREPVGWGRQSKRLLSGWKSVKRLFQTIETLPRRKIAAPMGNHLLYRSQRARGGDRSRDNRAGGELATKSQIRTQPKDG